MAIELGLRTLLLSHGTLTSLVPAQTVGSIRYDSIFNEYPSQGINPPFVLISVIDFDPLKHLGGTSGLAFTDIDVDCYARTYPAARQIAGVISDYLKDFSGTAGPDDTILAVLWNGQRYDVIRDDNGLDVRQHIVSLSFQLQHKPTR